MSAVGYTPLQCDFAALNVRGWDRFLHTLELGQAQKDAQNASVALCKSQGLILTGACGFFLH